MLELENVTKTYCKKKRKIDILDNVSYKFEKGKLYCIIGKSGSGKTTLIEIMGLLLSFESGKIKIDGKDITKISDKEKAMIRNKVIGFVFQSFYLNPLMKAYENVMLPMYINKDIEKNEYKNRALKLLESVGLSERYNHYPKELSGGEQQRVAIARALANNPEIILADEPTGALDSSNTDNILKILKDLSRDGKCVVIVSHDENVKSQADVVLKLEDKKLKEEL